MNDRVYELPSRRVLYARLCISLMTASFVALLIPEHAPVWACALVLLVCGLAMRSVFFGLDRKRPKESLDGLQTADTVTGTGGKLAWGDIERFERSTGRQKRMVYACTTRGRRVLLVGFDATSTTHWSGGQTDDIVGELNARLKGWRHELGVTEQKAQLSMDHLCEVEKSIGAS